MIFKKTFFKNIKNFINHYFHLIINMFIPFAFMNNLHYNQIMFLSFFSTKCNLAKYLQTNWKFGTSRTEQKLIIVNQISIGNRFSKINMKNSICYCQLSFYIFPFIVQQA